VVYVAFGLGLSAVLVRETHPHVAREVAAGGGDRVDAGLSQGEIFRRTTLTDRDLSAVTQAGLVNNLNDGMAWGIFPLIFAAAGLDLAAVGLLAALYPAVWGLGQLVTGGLSDRVGRKRLIAGGMFVQAAGLAAVAVGGGVPAFATGQVLLGVGTAMVYPTLLAAIGDVAHPTWRGSAVGIYRLWRDLGYAFGALVAGLVADALGLDAAVWGVMALTAASGVVVVVRLRETLTR
jgi:MFS family permease